MDWTGFDLIGVYGAVLATLLAIYELHKFQKKIIVKLRQYQIFKREPAGDIDFFLEFSFANRGMRLVEIDSIRLIFSRRNIQLFPEAFNEPVPVFPIALEDGRGKKFNIDLENFTKGLILEKERGIIEILPYVTTSEGKEYKGKSIKFDINFYKEWSEKKEALKKFEADHPKLDLRWDTLTDESKHQR